MNSAAWMRSLGESAWAHVSRGSDPEEVAAILTRASEIGCIMPTRPPKVDPKGHTIIWPEGVPGLTAGGLLTYWQSRGHKWLLLNIGPLCRAVAGPLLPRLQEILSAYHLQAMMEGEKPVAIDFHPFVGGEHEIYDRDVLFSDITQDCPSPQPKRVAKARSANG